MPLGIIVNPFSGRDVRRVAARASTSDHHEKQQQVTRLVLGALSMGVERIYLAHEPFRINEKAVENLAERNRVEILRYKLTHTAADTHTMASMMWEAGCRVFIVLGGDGTSRIVARSFTEATILPLSTGTNNVFPYRLEASVAGMAAGLVAAGKVSSEDCIRCKRIHIDKQDEHDIALIDAVVLRNDFLGNLLPFEADNLADIVLTRAEPASIGISPIGGFIEPTGLHDDHGVYVRCDQSASRKLEIPISPGLHQQVGIGNVRKLPLGETVEVRGPGVLAFDGDRTIKLLESETASIRVERDGPRIIEAEKVMAEAASQGVFEQNAS
ncbi:MAG: NAD(+)/NADH kinase [Pseudomonadales bacterium]|nr:NAD(+)/NADH kinase [Pseudomonadales bacterium]